MISVTNDTAGFSLETPDAPRAPADDCGIGKALDTAIGRGRAALLAEQREDGSWEDRTDLGPVGPAMQSIVERQFDVLSSEDAAQAARRVSSAA
jgi:hypothetical protein